MRLKRKSFHKSVVVVKWAFENLPLMCGFSHSPVDICATAREGVSGSGR